MKNAQKKSEHSSMVAQRKNNSNHMIEELNQIYHTLLHLEDNNDYNFINNP